MRHDTSGLDHVVNAGRHGLLYAPGTLPPPLTLEKLRVPHGSVPGNPLLAEPLYLTKYIERMGTGIRDMIELCRQAGLEEPEFSLTDGFVTTIPDKPRSGLQRYRLTSKGKALLDALKQEGGRV